MNTIAIMSSQAMMDVIAKGKNDIADKNYKVVEEEWLSL